MGILETEMDVTQSDILKGVGTEIQVILVTATENFDLG